MLSVVGFFATIQPNLFLIALSIATIAGLSVTAFLKLRAVERRWLGMIFVMIFVFVYVFEHMALKHFYDVSLVKIEMVHSLSHAKV